MKFFHIADVHLGATPDKGFPWSYDRGREIWESFQNVIRQAGRENVGLFLIAGDLFHRQPLLKELKEVNALFASIPNTKIVLIAGNHDYIKENSFYKRFHGQKTFSGFLRKSFPMWILLIWVFEYMVSAITAEKF